MASLAFYLVYFLLTLCLGIIMFFGVYNGIQNKGKSVLGLVKIVLLIGFAVFMVFIPENEALIVISIYTMAFFLCVALFSIVFFELRDRLLK